MHVLAYDDADRLYLALPAVALAAVAALAIGAGTATALGSRVDDGSSSRSQNAASTSASASGGCLLLRPLGDAVLTEATEVQKALQAQTEGMTDLQAHRLTADDAALRLSPALSAGSQHSVRLDVAVQRYKAAEAGCGG